MSVIKKKKTIVAENGHHWSPASTVTMLFIYLFLAQLFSKKASSSASCENLTFSNISDITEDIYLKLRIVVHYQKGNPYK